MNQKYSSASNVEIVPLGKFWGSFRHLPHQALSRVCTNSTNPKIKGYIYGRHKPREHGAGMRTTSNAAPGGYKMQQRSNVMDVAAFKDNQLASPDGTPPSNGLAEEAFRSATPNYYRRGTQQGWLGTDYRPDVGPAKPLGLRPEVNGTGSGITTEGSDIIGLMEAVWCVPGLSRSNVYVAPQTRAF